MGAQKNFAKFADRISDEWKLNSERYDEAYYRQAIARVVIFKAAEKIVSEQDWYNGGYRANIVAYTIALRVTALTRASAHSIFSGSGRCSQSSLNSQMPSRALDRSYRMICQSLQSEFLT